MTTKTHHAVIKIRDKKHSVEKVVSFKVQVARHWWWPFPWWPF